MADFILPNGTWNIPLLNEAILFEDVEIMKKIPLNPRLNYNLIWRFDKIGIYSVKSGYN